MPRLLVNPKYRLLARYSGLGIEFVVSVLVGLFGGQWLDGKMGTHGVFALAGFVLGVVAGFRLFFRAAKLMQEDAEREEREENDRFR